MAALNTLSSDVRLALANSLEASAKLVRGEVFHSPVNYQAAMTTQLAATKTLLDAAQG